VSGDGSGAATLQARVAEHLTRSILEQQLRPGEHIVAEKLAADLGVSRLPVREALHTLAGQGLVEMRPHRGAFVPPGDNAEELVWTVEVRARLEPWAAELAAARHRPEDLEAIDRALEAGARALQRGQRAVVGLAHHRFLRGLAAAAHHPRLDEALAPLQHRTMLAFATIRMRVEPGGWSAHTAVRDAVAAGDGETAATRTAEHLQAVITALRAPGNVQPAVIGAPRRREQSTG
jgi:DNA-binding GntR family transcriptional regulator